MFWVTMLLREELVTGRFWGAIVALVSLGKMESEVKTNSTRDKLLFSAPSNSL